MAGYSGTPLPTKLGIKKDHRVGLIHAPAGFAKVLGDLPEGVKIRQASRDHKIESDDLLDVMLFFTDNRAELVKEFRGLAGRLSPAGGLWIAWPKKASGVPTDLTEDRIREIGLEAGLVDNKVCAVDDTWSGLRFVHRLKDRPKLKN
ncbi:MAG TPA: DUF3052 family protein [Gemmataceae bacterium]|jgi:hypothetical protein|nr:DUF3052 family protein [Gemmataceae bacterium]